MARIEIPMPQMGESIAEGTVAVWLKQVGDRVERDEGIMEISTDKVDAEIPSPAAGVLAEIVVHEGETVEVGTVVGFIETGAGGAAGAGEEPDSTSGVAGPAERAPGGSGAQEVEISRVRSPESLAGKRNAAVPGGESGSESAAAPGLTEWAAASPSQEGEHERLRRLSTPLVRRMAAEHGVSLSELSGSGYAGRVTRRDLEEYLERHPADERAPVSAGGLAGLDWAAFHSRVEHPEIEIGPLDRVEPMDRMTARIADHMVLSRRISAHVHTVFEVDYSRIDRVRMRDRALWEGQGLRITYTVFIARAVAQALREHPLLNAAISGKRIIHRGEVNLGIAVALERGLIVPVIRRADELSLSGLARAIEDLARRARDRQLAPEEVQGGTFTITNPGGFGSILGFPILNQPQVAILAVGAVEKRPTVWIDEFGNDAIVSRKRGSLVLGFDHRLINGADADRFMARVKELMENPEREG